ncbi:MAG: RNA polymerase sigma factor [Armatimonadota bacterium]
MHTAERLWRQRVRAVFRSGGVSSNDIEDLCQEVAISYFQIRGVAPWDDTSAQPHLVAHLIKSTLSDYFAQLRRYSELLRRYASYVVLAQTPEDSVKKPDLISKLSELPPNLREIVEMKVVEGYTFPEISALTSCPEGTVKARYYKGIAILRKALQQETTFWSTLGINIIETGDKEAQNNHASQDVGEDSATSGSAGGG